MADEQQAAPSTDLERLLGQAIEKVKQDAISFDDLKELITQPASAFLPTPVSPPAQITKKEREALERLSEVFGQVVPTEVRALEPKEIDQLLAERETLKTIEEMAKKRISDGIRTTVLNHNDTVFAEGKDEKDLAEADRTKDGHYVAPGKYPGEGDREDAFAVTVTKGRPQIDPVALKALAEDENEPWFTHEDYLRWTTQTRVFDEAKVFLDLKKHPELVRALHHVTVRSNPTLTVQPRKT
jgi:hypothetical protein